MHCLSMYPSDKSHHSAVLPHVAKLFRVLLPLAVPLLGVVVRLELGKPLFQSAVFLLDILLWRRSTVLLASDCFLHALPRPIANSGDKWQSMSGVVVYTITVLDK